MANHQRDAGREGRWRELLARHVTSGLSVRAFCRQEKLNESSFYAWRRTIGQRDREAARRVAPAFVPAVVTDEGIDDASLAIELPCGCVLRLSGSTAVEQVADLVIALQQWSAR